MTPNEYISSGMLELYALGSLSPSEMKEVENMMALHPEVKAEVENIRKGLETYADAHAIIPDPSLREFILDNALRPDQNAPTVTAPLTAVSRWKNTAIAACLFLIASIGLNIYNAVRITRINESYDNIVKSNEMILANNNSVIQDNKLVHQELADAYIQLSILNDTMTKNIPLNSIVAGHPMNSVVHWNKRTMEVAIDPMTLPKTDSTGKYVFWAIVNGVPVNEGSFTKGEATGMIMMDKVMKADAFAISLEKDAKTTAPVGPIYVLGQSK